MASSCSECNNLFKSQSKIKRWARTKRDAHTRKEGTGKCVRCFNKNRRREQRKNARKRLHSEDAKTPSKKIRTETPCTEKTKDKTRILALQSQLKSVENMMSKVLLRNDVLEANCASLRKDLTRKFTEKSTQTNIRPNF